MGLAVRLRKRINLDSKKRKEGRVREKGRGMPEDRSQDAAS